MCSYPSILPPLAHINSTSCSKAKLAIFGIWFNLSNSYFQGKTMKRNPIWIFQSLCRFVVFYALTFAVIQILMGQSCMKKHQILLLHIGSVLPSLHFYLAFIVESSLDFSLDEIFRFCGHWHPATTQGSLPSIWYESHFLQNQSNALSTESGRKALWARKVRSFHPINPQFHLPSFSLIPVSIGQFFPAPNSFTQFYFQSSLICTFGLIFSASV